MEASRQRVIAAGFDPGLWVEGERQGALADALFAARRAYHAHFGAHLRRFREGE